MSIVRGGSVCVGTRDKQHDFIGKTSVGECAPDARSAFDEQAGDAIGCQRLKNGREPKGAADHG